MNCLMMTKNGAFAVFVLLLGAVSYADQPPLNPVPSKGGSRIVVLSCPTDGIDGFSKLASFAKEIGATHLDISDLPKDRWQWYDPQDPYPNWSMIQSGILKIMVPPELRPTVPEDNAKVSQGILRQRGEILRKNGLRAVFHGAEPMWLPEGVYERHPLWRGSRCQSPIRSRHDYFAPNIDDPEVLDLYRRATEGLCRLVPVEEFSFLANDSGSGICWHPGLYPYPNGPEASRERPMRDRLQGFMKALHEGAADAGVDAEVTFAGDHLSVPGRPAVKASAGDSNYLWSSCCYPVLGIPDYVTFAQELQKLTVLPDAEWQIGIPSADDETAFDLIRLSRKSIGTGPVARAKLLEAAAGRRVGHDAAPGMIEVWQHLHDAIRSIRTIDNGGPVLLLGTVNQRWLNRPLVPFPLELKPEEKDYYRRYQFQATTEEAAANLMNCQGLFLISGDTGTALASSQFHQALQSLKKAGDILEGIRKLELENEYVRHLDLRVKTLAFVIRNADITARYQAFLERFQPGWAFRPDRCGYPVPEEGVAIVREDMANTRELISLLRSSDIPLLASSKTAGGEDTFLFGPDLIAQLEKKVALEEFHLPSHQRLLHP